MAQKFIPLSVPNLKGRELELVSEAINTEWVSTGGKYINDFEAAISGYVKSSGAVACQSGTAGLHMSLLIAGVTSADEVIVPTLTFIAAVNPVKYVGANPVFMDCDSDLCLDPEKLKKFCEDECDYRDGKLINRKTNKHVKAIIVVHVFGNMADMEKIMEITRKYGLFVIEDATEAIGTYYTSGVYSGKFAGTIGDIGVFSFNGNKIITTGGGGAIVSNQSAFLERAKHLTTQAKSDELYYTHDEIGYNYRMTNVQAAIGLAQLEQLEKFIETKIENYHLYASEISKIKGIELLSFRANTRPNYWFYSLLISEDWKMNRDDLIQFLQDNKVQTRPIWGLIHEQKPYLNDYAYQIENATTYYTKVINLPCSTNLNADDINYVLSLIK